MDKKKELKTLIKELGLSQYDVNCLMNEIRDESKEQLSEQYAFLTDSDIVMDYVDADEESIAISLYDDRYQQLNLWFTINPETQVINDDIQIAPHFNSFSLSLLKNGNAICKDDEIKLKNVEVDDFIIDITASYGKGLKVTELTPSMLKGFVDKTLSNLQVVFDIALSKKMKPFQKG